MVWRRGIWRRRRGKFITPQPPFAQGGQEKEIFCIRGAMMERYSCITRPTMFLTGNKRARALAVNIILLGCKNFLAGQRKARRLKKVFLRRCWRWRGSKKNWK